jgi:DNA-directed RNA polymerase specialized sigma24 family protein
MQPTRKSGLAFAVVTGGTYGEPGQVFNRCLMPVYQTSYRWTGNRLDAEDVTTWVFINEFRRLHLPQAVTDVDDQMIEATVEAIGKHWTERYGIPPRRWSAFHAGEVATPWRSTMSLRALLDPLPGELRLVVVLRFLRRRTVTQIANQLDVSPANAAILIFKALGGIGTEIGLGPSVDDASQAREVSTFVDHLVTRRRPPRFEATPAALQVLLAATFVHSAIAGNDLPQPRFLSSLKEEVIAGGRPAA